MERQEIIRIRDLSFSYDARPFLEGINLTIYADDFLGIMGQVLVIDIEDLILSRTVLSSFSSSV